MNSRLTENKKSKKKRVWNLKTKIVVALRQVWLRSPLRYEAIKNAREHPNQYRCAICREFFPAKEIRVDHIVKVVGAKGIDSWDDFISALFCDATNLQILCVPCHKEKTKQERQASCLARE